GHYEVSQTLGERELFPAIRSAADGTIVLADGFSCRTQIAQGTGADGVHLAEGMRAALPPAEPGEREPRRERPRPGRAPPPAAVSVALPRMKHLGGIPSRDVARHDVRPRRISPRVFALPRPPPRPGSPRPRRSPAPHRLRGRGAGAD